MTDMPQGDFAPLIPFLFRHREPPELTEAELQLWYEGYRDEHSGEEAEGPVSRFEGVDIPYLANHQFNADPHFAPDVPPPLDAIRELHAADWALTHVDSGPADHTRDRSLLHRALHRCGWTHG